MIIVVLCIFLIYDALLISLFFGWLRVIKKKTVNAVAHPFITVLVAARNEERNISALLDCLVKQRYKNFEIIVIDDHSEDQTVSLTANFQNPIVRCVSNKGIGKKAAITTGIDYAHGDIIVTTDADCTMSPDWLQTISNNFSDPGIVMVIAPVKIQDSKSFFYQLQQLEFVSVIGTSASTIGLGTPTMCNGANLAYRKEIFNSVKGYEGNQQIPSGDDEFLMRKICKQFPGSVKFLADRRTIVSTLAQPRLSDFINQRVRWAGKWRFNSSLLALFLAFFVVGIQITTLYCYFEIVNTGDTMLIFTLAIKITLEGFLLMSFCRFLETPWRLHSFLSLQIVYPIYIVWISVLAISGRYTWKNRTVE